MYIAYCMLSASSVCTVCVFLLGLYRSVHYAHYTTQRSLVIGFSLSHLLCSPSRSLAAELLRLAKKITVRSGQKVYLLPRLNAWVHLASPTQGPRSDKRNVKNLIRSW